MSTKSEIVEIISALEDDVKQLKSEISNLGVAHTVPGAQDSVTVADYLLERLVQLGVTTMFGLPGDFNLGFLDYVEANPKIQWAGDCNELNASYAADGYARIKQGSIGVLLTTFGVGELSAVNGIAGAFAERVPVLHIVGVPSTVQQKTKPLLHHTLGNGRFDAYEKAFENFVCTHANLLNLDHVAEEIDRVIRETVIQAKPSYLMLPTDIVHKKIDRKRLSQKLDFARPLNSPEVEEFVLTEIVKLIEEADRDVVILLDACVVRYQVQKEVKELAQKTRFPVFAAPMGKSAIDETYERYGGIYDGTISRPEVIQAVENAKLLLFVGGVRSDYNTGNFSNTVPKTRVVELHSDHTIVQYATFANIGMKQLLPKLTEHLKPYAEGAQQIEVPRFTSPVPQDPGDTISHVWFWPRVGKFFQPRDIIVGETGTSSFGLLDVPLPEGATFVAQILWGSIGWSVGATLGAALAAKDVGIPRTVLFVGDGSLQLTFQELSVMQKLGVTPVIFVLNNSGYTIERFIHGMNAKYNDIRNWEWTSLLKTLGGVEGKTYNAYTVRTKTELSQLLDSPSLAKPDKIQFVEVIMPMHDAPRALKVQAELSGITNKYTD